MATPSELSLEEIRKYLLENGGTARNHDVVKYFKKFLTDPETRVEARNRFKEYVNTLATIKNEEGEKYLVLKKKYRQASLDLSNPENVNSTHTSPNSPQREPPPYRAPPPAPLSPTSTNTQESNRENDAHTNFESDIETRKQIHSDEAVSSSASSPPVPPRRKGQDKIRMDSKENIEKSKTGTDGVNKGADEEDSASVAWQLDGKSREWLVKAAQGDYHEMAKLAAVEPRLTGLKDPTSGTALHWAAKHGDENIVKMIAGTYREYVKDVNVTTNGGYTPLHIAMQFDHENVFNLLVQVYGANQEIRDYSGKKARQYLVSQEAAVSQDTFRKIKARKKHAEKDLGFLRIGSLNVRVKRTTEAFSQFLGVATSSSNSNNNSEKIHKSWGSADNVQKLDQKVMPPPKYAPVKKRRSRRNQDFSRGQQQTASQPNTPLLQGKATIRQNQITSRRPTSTSSVNSAIPTNQQNNDSDSDTACGFDSAWRGSAQL
ncbi:ankyrin repeat domain-containing protein SOWAHC isoform X3 [Polistes fuscatus]|uniref:ankyrin repeat domain-containing protein SOWAHC isoform X3 n=1 Tax=Polistes fuscatus TaxID=30207 RepID=UPI001CA8544D|nr:ankyrin repeat domain-containing protein SOWAHC isoform X3 [Polistes fuscatus]